MRVLPLSASAFGALLLSATWSAALTPEEVWTEWNDALTESGAEVMIGSEKRQTAALELRDVQILSQASEGEKRRVTSLEMLRFTDQGDETVAVVLPEKIIIGTAPNESAETSAQRPIILSPKGAEIVASGEAGAIRYDYQIANLEIAFQSEPELTQSDAIIKANVENISGWNFFTIEPKLDIKGQFFTEQLRFDMELLRKKAAVNSPEEGTISARVDGISATWAGEISDLELLDKPELMGEGDFTFLMDMDLGAMDLALEAIKDGQKHDLSAQVSGFTLDANLHPGQYLLSMNVPGGKFMSNLPIPEIPSGEYSLEQAKLEVDMPLPKSGETGDYDIEVRLDALSLPDALWSQMDPKAVFERTALSFAMDFGGTIRNVVMDQPPELKLSFNDQVYPIETLQVKELSASGLGASVAADGDLRFDYTDMQTFPGFPMPDGKVSINLTGLSKLIDNFATLGLIPAENMTPLRMGIAMFTRAGDAPDSSVSLIEFKDKGLFINGRKIM